LNVQAPGSRIGEVAVFAVDATRDLGSAAVVAADSTGRVEVIDARDGTWWVEARVAELLVRHGGVFAVDVGGPLGYLADRVDGEVRRLGTRDMAHASQGFLDSVFDGKVRVYPSPKLDAAVAAASRRQVGDGWIWNRSAGEDASPLLAATVALHAARGFEEDYDVADSFY